MPILHKNHTGKIISFEIYFGWIVKETESYAESHFYLVFPGNIVANFIAYSCLENAYY